MTWPFIVAIICGVIILICLTISLLDPDTEFFLDIIAVVFFIVGMVFLFTGVSMEKNEYETEVKEQLKTIQDLGFVDVGDLIDDNFAVDPNGVMVVIVKDNPVTLEVRK